MLEAGMAFTESSLSLRSVSSNELIPGNSILNQGKLAFAGAKKYLGFYEIFCDDKGNYPSGKTDQDATAFILSKFTSEAEGGGGGADNDDGQEDGPDDESGENDSSIQDVPATFFPFFVFGPMAEKGYQLPQFTRVIGQRQKSDGRQAQRIKEEKGEAAQRQRDDSRGTAFGASAFQAASLSVDADELELKKKQAKYLAINSEIKSSSDRAKQFSDMMNAVHCPEARKASLFERWTSAMDRAEQLEGELQHLREEIDSITTKGEVGAFNERARKRLAVSAPSSINATSGSSSSSSSSSNSADRRLVNLSASPPQPALNFEEV